MKIGILMDVPGGTQAQYDETMRNLGLALGQSEEGWPKGILSHTAGPIKNGWRVVDIWESRDDFQKFFKERLGAAVKKAGLPAFEPQFFDVYNTRQSC